MAATAYRFLQEATRERVGARAADWLATRRNARLERRLAPAEAGFFDAYSRGGERRHGPLVIDYDFVARPRVRELLRRAVSGRPLDHGALETEYLAWDPRPNLERFRANAVHLGSHLAGRA